MKPLKCEYCGAEEWRHVCGKAARASGIGLSTTVSVVDTVVDRKVAVVDARAKDRHRKTEERREYLKVKQRESRARRVAGRVS